MRLLFKIGHDLPKSRCSILGEAYGEFYEVDLIEQTADAASQGVLG